MEHSQVRFICALFIVFFAHARGDHRVLSRKYLHDATNVYAQLDFNKREGLIKLVFYLLSFFYYLYRYAAITVFRFSRANIVAPRSMILGLLEVN